ncbi:hypothetical protein DFH07DRAFT_826178 [Mycena maculata]|uniref:Uncharacterized protein n=1 Tax=Mycena maculata TaxID=230809 RepID=A0AAD7IZQ1_9AGAR|nr:hypothetical protein DFH07DRAFT_826178 [Mycena maculata]
MIIDDSSLSRPAPRPRGLQRHLLPHLRPRPLRGPGQHRKRRRLRRPRRLALVRPAADEERERDGPSAALLDKVRVLDALPRVGALWTLDLKGNDLTRFFHFHRRGEDPLCAEEITILSRSGVRELGKKGTELIVTPMKVHLMSAPRQRWRASA